MVFSSPLFLFAFLPLLLLAHFMLPGRSVQLRNALLLVASLLFYAHGESVFVLAMVASILFNYGAGRMVAAARTAARRRYVLALAVCGNIGLLCFFKYTNFAVDSLNGLLAALGVPLLHVGLIHLPAGISFFTFHALSYVVDVYRGDAKEQRLVQDLALYFAFFPQLIAGPIIRYHDVSDQLSARSLRAEDFAEGTKRFIVGLGKKVLVANTLGQRVDAILALPAAEFSTPLAWLAMVGYTLQLYFDFSGYSDMAIGLARMFGFRFLENFNYPYVARSITDFWRRWHISLSSWFRDYLYIPLGGNRGSVWATYRNLLVVFFLCGLWHGASWKFVVWGLFHGAFLVFERIGPVRAAIDKLGPLAHAYALLVVLVGWVFFRTDDLAHASTVLKTLCGLQPASAQALPLAYYLDGSFALALVFGVIGSAPIVPWLTRQRLPVSGLAYVALGLVFVGSMLTISAESYSPFIYFRF